MSDTGTPGLSQLLSRLNAHVAGTAADGTVLPPPSATDAMATYLVAARLVELELRRAELGPRDEQELSITRDVLVGTHRMLCAALDEAENRTGQHEPWRRAGRPALLVVEGGAAPSRHVPGTRS